MGSVVWALLCGGKGDVGWQGGCGGGGGEDGGGNEERGCLAGGIQFD